MFSGEHYTDQVRTLDTHRGHMGINFLRPVAVEFHHRGGFQVKTPNGAECNVGSTVRSLGVVNRFTIINVIVECALNRPQYQTLTYRFYKCVSTFSRHISRSQAIVAGQGGCWYTGKSCIETIVLLRPRAGEVFFVG